MKVELDKTIISLNSEDDLTSTINITLNKDVNKKIKNKDLFIILPHELEFTEGYNHYTFNFEKDEDLIEIETKIQPKSDELGDIKTGKYDILIFTDDYEYKKELVVKTK